MYDRAETVKWFEAYCESGTPEDLEKLIGSCSGLVTAIVGKYPEFNPHREDIAQEVMLKMWLMFKNRPRMQRELKNPWAFISLTVGILVWKTMCQCAKAYQISMVMTDNDKTIIEMHESGGADWETIGKRLGISPETARVYYSVAKQKELRWPTISYDDPSFVEKAGDESLDPARRYELKDLNRYWKGEMAKLLAKHPNASKMKSEYGDNIDLLFDEEIEMESV